LGSAAEAGAGTPRPQQYSLAGRHVALAVVLHPLSPSVERPAHLLAWHAAHAVALLA